MTPADNAQDSAQKCTQTGCLNDLDTTGNPRWCKRCRADYQKQYRALKGEVLERKAYAQGVTAFRTMVIGEFVRLGNGNFTGFEVAHLLSGAKAPELAESPDA